MYSKNVANVFATRLMDLAIQDVVTPGFVPPTPRKMFTAQACDHPNAVNELAVIVADTKEQAVNFIKHSLKSVPDTSPDKIFCINSITPIFGGEKYLKKGDVGYTEEYVNAVLDDLERKTAIVVDAALNNRYWTIEPGEYL